jgi:acetyl-CoA carboxylase biotin carboxylase subunit
MRRVLIANRGEIAVRIIRACRELGLETVAVASEPDLDAPHARLADRVVPIGPADPSKSYLHRGRLIDAARETGADAVHPGYGFLAESAAFAADVAGAGLRFVGPPAEVIERLGDKTAARALAERAKIPIVPGFVPEPGGAGSEDGEALAAAAGRLGYPVMIKAAAGGGGRGMRLVEREDDFRAACASAAREAQAAFGDGRLFLERRLSDVRHVEVQILADAHGAVAALGERECSVQRRHQKLIEEAPSPRVDAALRGRLAAAAVAIAGAARYVNAGTVEFLMVPDGGFYFLEVNTRLQVEHPVTELVTGLDVVKAQLRIAAGRRLADAGVPAAPPIEPRGHAIECRVCAEDPAEGFRPTPGTIALLDEPAGPGVRVDSGIREGWRVPGAYDSLLAKLVVWDRTREDAVARMAQALAQYVVLGCGTNVTFLRDVVRHDAFRRGETTTDFLDRHFGGWQPDSPAEVLAVAAALASMPRQHGAEDALAPAVRDPWDDSAGWRMGGRG